MIKTPIYNKAGTQLVKNPMKNIRSNDNEIHIFRLVANKLGKATFRPSLKESLKLSWEPATIALRNQMQIWLNELTKGNLDEVDKIQKEINKATNALSKFKGVKTVGTITTWVGVPVAITEMILNLPPVLGISVSSVGKITSAIEGHVTKKYKWAMYGNT